MDSETKEYDSYYDELWEIVNNNVSKVAMDEQDYKFLLSIAMGASVATETFLTNCESIKPYYNNGSLDKVRNITMLFACIMLSQCYRWVSKNNSKGLDSLLPKEVVSTKVIFMHQVVPEDWMEEFGILDTQFNYDLDTHKHIIHLSGIIIAKACQICGHQCINFKNVDFPVAEFKDILSEDILIDRTPMQNQNDINAVQAAIGNGIAAMNQYAEKASN